MLESELKAALSAAVDKLVPVAGTLMAVACEQDFIHEADCDCRLCRAFVATQAVQNELQAVVRLLPGDQAPRAADGVRGGR